MFQTKNDLAQGTRQNAASLLQERVCDALDLAMQCKQAHWNVKGPEFISLHGLFDQIHEEVETWADILAERVMQVGGSVRATCQDVAKESSLTEYPKDTVAQADHIEALSSALAEFGRRARKAVTLTDQWGDAVTSDIFTEICRAVDKNLWFVEAHLSMKGEAAKTSREVA